MSKLQWSTLILSLIGLGLLFYEAFLFNSQTVKIIAYVVIGIAVVFVLILGFKPKYCSNCNTKLPLMRAPANTKQAMQGGWTCPKCGKELDSSGKVIQTSS